MSDIGLYGEHLWSGTGKRAVVCEGEIDAMSISQVQGNTWEVVSVKNGAQGAKKNIQQNLINKANIEQAKKFLSNGGLMKTLEDKYTITSEARTELVNE